MCFKVFKFFIDQKPKTLITEKRYAQNPKYKKKKNILKQFGLNYFQKSKLRTEKAKINA